MRVIAFGCCHIATPKTMAYLHGEASLEPFKRLVDIILADPPDQVVNLGDFEEPYYEQPGLSLEIAPAYAAIENVATLRGNHDKEGLASFEADGIRYVHGHGGPRETKAIRRHYAKQRLIHAHTHIPYEGWAFDVGSVTYSQTYAEIIDGMPALRGIAL